MHTSAMRRLLWLLGIVAALGLGSWLVLRHAPPQIAWLPDGTKVTLLTATYGKHHSLRMRTGNWLQWMLPPREVGSLNTETDSLVVWTSAERPNGPVSQVTFAGWVRKELSDENGHRVRLNTVWNPSLISSFNPINTDAFANFPRRGRRVIVRYYRDDQPQRPIIEFNVPNPVSGPFPHWTPDPLPITRSEGRLSATLTGVRLVPHIIVRNPGGGYTTMEKSQYSPRLYRSMPGQPPPTTEEMVHSHVYFQLKESGKPTHDWTVGSNTMTDATGNVITSRSVYSQVDSGLFHCIFEENFCTGETVGKVRIECFRSENAPFAPDEQQQVAGVALPAKNRSLHAPTIAFDGVPIDLFVTGAGKSQLTKTLSFETNIPCVLLKMPASVRNVHPLLRVTDDRGTLLTTMLSRYSGGYSSGTSSSEKGTVISINLSSPPPARRVEASGWITSRYSFEESPDHGQVLVYPLWDVQVGTKLKLALVANKSRFLEFMVPLPPR